MVNRIIATLSIGMKGRLFLPKATNPEPFPIQGLPILFRIYQKIKFELIDRS